jgi:acyl carrier protein
MGLELVEIVIEVEETFGIIVSDDTAANIRTVGQLHDYILDRRRQTQQHGCPTGHVFRDVRRVLTETASLPRQAIRPSTELKTILPPRIRRRVWKRLQQEAQGRLPDLCLPFRLGPVLAGACLVAGVIGTVMIVPHVGLVHAMVLGGTALVAMLLVAFFVTRPFALSFPHGVATVGDVARATLPPKYEAAVKQQMTDEEVWEKLRKIVADTLGVKVEKVTPSARFVEDLGAG